jgi:hypothetical protein
MQLVSVKSILLQQSCHTRYLFKEETDPTLYEVSLKESPPQLTFYGTQ